MQILPTELIIPRSIKFHDDRAIISCKNVKNNMLKMNVKTFGQDHKVTSLSILYLTVEESSFHV